VLFALWLIIFSGWEQIRIYLILINVIILVLRKPLVVLAAYLFKRRFYKTMVSIIINGVLGVFLLWLLLDFSAELFIALLSFMIVAISLNFSKIINNIASGGLLLMSEQFDVGDLIETNDVQGIVKEVNLNYLKLREFDGVDLILPNSNVYGSTIVKFTHSKFKVFEPLDKEEFEKEKDYRRYIKTINKLLEAKIKLTKYVKHPEIRKGVDPENLEEYLFNVFDRYEPIFGKRPAYSVDKTRYGRVRLNLYIISEKPQLVIQYIDAFLRDLVYELYPDEIFLEWEEYKKKEGKKK
jgi:small-conductance mechanosensitive channel